MAPNTPYLQNVQGIASLINNPIVILWQQGYIQSAAADVEFIAVSEGPLADAAKAAGDLMVRVKCDDPNLQANFPPSLFLFIPRTAAKQIINEVFAARIAVLQHLAEMQESIDAPGEDGEVLGSSSSYDTDLPSLGPDQVEPRDEFPDTGLPDS